MRGADRLYAGMRVCGENRFVLELYEPTAGRGSVTPRQNPPLSPSATPHYLRMLAVTVVVLLRLSPTGVQFHRDGE